eukprot:12906221-Prorocentrum_lima.AAC.1
MKSPWHSVSGRRKTCKLTHKEPLHWQQKTWLAILPANVRTLLCAPECQGWGCEKRGEEQRDA